MILVILHEGATYAVKYIKERVLTHMFTVLGVNI